MLPVHLCVNSQAPNTASAVTDARYASEDCSALQITCTKWSLNQMDINGKNSWSEPLRQMAKLASTLTGLGFCAHSL